MGCEDADGLVLESFKPKLLIYNCWLLFLG